MKLLPWLLLGVMGGGFAATPITANAKAPTTALATSSLTQSFCNAGLSHRPSTRGKSRNLSSSLSYQTVTQGHSGASSVTRAPNIHLPALVWFGPTIHRAVYITIDDGWFPSQSVLRLMQRTHLPITAFLIKEAVQEHLSYWKAFVRAGGMIEDHTVSHPPLTSLSPAHVYFQWHTPVIDYTRWFGVAPTLGRPPYGAINRAVLKEAYRAGLRHVIMWSATMDQQGLQTWNRGPLRPGDIVLLHWDPGLYSELVRLLATIHADHLMPASLPLALSSGARG